MLHPTVSASLCYYAHDGLTDACTFVFCKYKTNIKLCSTFLGRFLWSLWQGDSQEEIIKAGLWSLGNGMSSAVMQIPRARATRVLKELKKQKDQKQELQELLKQWLIESDGFCAKLVLFSSVNGSKFS